MTGSARRPRRAAVCLAALTGAFAALAPAHAGPDPDRSVDRIPTASPIKHVIIIVGENRSFDHLFATYVPKTRGERVLNLLSQGIIKADGSPGPRFAKGHQFKITAPPNGSGKFFISAGSAAKTLYTTLPAPDVGGVQNPPGAVILTIPGGDPGTAAAGPVPVRHRRHRPAVHARPRHPHHQRQQPAARAVPDDRADHAVRRLHGRHDPSVLPDVPADGLRDRRRARLARQPDRLPARPAVGGHHDLLDRRPTARRTTPARPWRSSTCSRATCRCSSASPTSTR